MKCPKCDSSTHTMATQSYLNGNGIRRRHRCPKCDERFWTVEQVCLEESYAEGQRLTKYSRKQVATVKYFLLQNLPVSWIAKKTGVSKDAVYKIKRSKMPSCRDIPPHNYIDDLNFI